MPIRAENKGRYPKDWPEISKRIRFDRAGGRCECEGECGRRHVLGENGKQLDLPPDVWIVPPERCGATNGRPHPITGAKVVLTVAHLDHQPENCADDNLKAWCQRCHNRYDAKTRAAGIKQRRHDASASGDLFALPQPHLTEQEKK